MQKIVSLIITPVEKVGLPPNPRPIKGVYMHPFEYLPN
jgi:hypothetical protein